MHVLDLSEPIDLTKLGFSKIEPGSYLCDDVNAAELMLKAKRGSARVTYQWMERSVLSRRTNWNYLKVLFIRAGV